MAGKSERTIGSGETLKLLLCPPYKLDRRADFVQCLRFRFDDDSLVRDYAGDHAGSGRDSGLGRQGRDDCSRSRGHCLATGSDSCPSSTRLDKQASINASGRRPVKRDTYSSGRASSCQVGVSPLCRSGLGGLGHPSSRGGLDLSQLERKSTAL